MRILMITPYLPFPLHSGGQIRTYNLLKNLAGQHEVTLLAFVKNIVQSDIKEVEKYCQQVRVILRRRAFSPLNVLLAGLTPYPFLVAIYLSLALRKMVKDELASGHYDLIHAETFYVMPNIPKTKVPVILVEQTIEYLVYDHFVQTLKNPFLKPLLSFDVAKIKFWESYYWQKASKVVAMSEADCLKMKALVPNLSCEIVPNGIDTDFFGGVKRQLQSTKTVIFVGNFSWLQNREAVVFLVNYVWPQIAKRLRNVKLLIAGRNPTPEIRRFGRRENIAVVDDVEDIRQVYRIGDVMVAPIFGPGGTRYKILEAMASGVPVVTTAVGIEGIPVRTGREVLIGETASQLAKAAIQILEDNRLAQKLAVAAARLVKSRFSWPVIARQLSTLYAEVGRDGR